ncbi:MAG: site-specific DNA-methyltransferase [Bacteroidales bacterium]|nr:site-specific DNA-methyltransferase [Bacteroidales bacterium]
MRLSDNIKFTVDQQNSVGGDDCKNILIKGDNKAILPELVSSYRGKIKCIYIDPPYNNGDSYHYYNDNTTTSAWLKDMRNVLSWLKMLLKKDGSIWISIDDKEMAYLKVEADKIFGRDNFASTIIWQQRKTRENRAVFSCNHEYVLVYAKDIRTFKKSRNLIPVGKDFIDSKYKNPDNDPRGPWQSVSASVQAGHAVASQFYTIISPAGVEFNPPKGRCWAYNQEKMLREIAEGNIWFGLEGRNTPRIKKFLANAKIGLTPETIWAGENYGTTDSAKKHLLSLFPEITNVFDTPKPEELIKQIIEIASNKEEYVLDCFAGSGTTMATAQKLNRHYIGIEIGEQMSDLVVRRLNKVIAGEQGGISENVNWHGGGEFLYYIFDKNRKDNTPISHPTPSNQVHIKQLNFLNLFEQYAFEPITQNSMIRETISIEYKTAPFHLRQPIDISKNLLICNVKKDNLEQYLDGSAKIYYTGKRFPTTVALNKLYYFMPYLSGKGIRDLYYIKIARLGCRKEGQENEDKKDLRLVFEIEYVAQLFDVYKMVKLEIWRTFTDTNIEKILE